VWLPPLGEPDPLDELLPPLAVHPRRGLTTLDERPHGALVAAVGTVDRPLEQRRDVLALDLSGAGGHAIVVGGPRSGRSTLLRDAVTSLALTHTPQEAQFYVLDFGGGGFTALRELPHVGGVASRLEAGPVRRTVAEVLTVLVAREKLFAGFGIESMAAYRRMRREGRMPAGAGEDRFGDVFLVVDGWGSVRTDFEDLEPALTEIATRGLSYGVHLLVSAGRWTEVRPAARDMLTTRLELRLGDPTDSELGRRAAMNVPEGTPGRGLTPGGHHFLAALPRVDGGSGVDDLPEGTAGLVAAVKRAWTGPVAPPVRLLPTRLPYARLAIDDPRPGIPIGVAEHDLGPVLLEVQSEPHVLLYGDVESGKTAFLRAYAQAVVDRCSPEEARIIVVDYRRGLLGAVPPSHLIGFGHTAPEATDILREVRQVMEGRLPGREVTPEQLRDRSWWSGPDLFVLVDDYDLVSGATNPVAVLQDLLPQARDIGLHLVLARRTGGASRSLFEPVTATLRDLSSPGILLSGDRDEGPLVGGLRPSVQPPGRGWLVTRRGGRRLVQLAWLEPQVGDR
jgi:S-DNA-T family DNA segregation ATPase FtsK/SpoIIIE